MRPHKPRELVEALGKKGFVPQDGQDHVWMRLYIGSRRTDIRTKISRGSNVVYGDDLLKKVREQLGLNRREFENLVQCPLSLADYANLMVERNHA